MIHIEHQRLCKTTDKILVAVSGGVDSMVMLHLFREAGFNLAIAHCNFQLRGEQADADEALVVAAGQQLRVPIHCQRFDTLDYAKAHGLSVQMAARELRYHFFDTVVAAHGYDLIATAHHLNDSLETTVLNLARGSGLAGLAGIPVRQGRVIRPMLFATRETIEAYARARDIPWREDESNASDDYQRNFVRHRIVPLLRELNPGLEKTFALTLERLGQAHAIVDGCVDGIEATHVDRSGQRITLETGPIRDSQGGVLLLHELLRPFGFQYPQCRDILASAQAGKQFFSPTHVLTVDRERCIVEPRAEADAFSVSLGIGDSLAEGAGQRLSIEVVDRERFALSREKNIGQFDLDALTFPLTWRTWRRGDSMMPLGMANRKKLSDVLIDEKVSVPDKARTTVIEAGGEIVWVVGLRTAEVAKVTDRTRKIVVMRASAK